MYIAIEGVIGVGKTTLARLLKPAFQAEILLEVFEENPFLSNFYEDRARYAFQTQMFFLLSRYHQQRRTISEMIKKQGNLIADYTFDKDSLFARINLKGDELDMYYSVHKALGEKIVLPDLIIYLKASTDVLMHRIAFRDRHYERNMERDYIDDLNHVYEEYFSEQNQHPSQILKIDTDNLNYVADEKELEWVEDRIRQALQMPPYQTELPLEISKG